MGLRIPSYTLAPVLVLLGLISCYFFIYYAGDVLPGSNWTTIRGNIIPLFPYIIVLTMAFHAVLAITKRGPSYSNLNKELKTFLFLPICSGIGTIMAMVTEVMYDRGILIDAYISGNITLADLQSSIIIVFLFLGIMIGALLSRR